MKKSEKIEGGLPGITTKSPSTSMGGNGDKDDKDDEEAEI